MAKYALLIGTDTYQDPSFADLLVPRKDIVSFHAVLTNNKIAAFPPDNSQVLLNRPLEEVRKAVGAFFRDRKKDDLLLFYYSGHGELDEDGDLYLALGSTEKTNLMGTALEASMLENCFRKCSATRQIIILDCCYSGAMSTGGKSAIHAKELDRWKGHGREILTSSSATQKSWEGRALGIDSDHSVFTHYLVEGLKTGKAANSEQITVEQMFNYASTKVNQQTSRMTPERRVENQRENIVIAKNPSPPLKLPADLLAGLTDVNYLARERAVQVLDEKYIRNKDPETAEKVLELLRARLQGENEETDYRVRAALEAVIAANLEPPRSEPESPEPAVAKSPESEPPLQESPTEIPDSPTPAISGQTSDEPVTATESSTLIRAKWPVLAAVLLVLAIGLLFGYMAYQDDSAQQKLTESEAGPGSMAPGTSRSGEAETRDKGTEQAKKNFSTAPEEPGPECDIAAVRNSFRDRHIPPDMVRSIQRLLRDGGFLTAEPDGVPGSTTYQALVRLCRYLDAAGALEATATVDQETAALLPWLPQNSEGMNEIRDRLRSQTSNISIAAGDCGCSRDFTARVYGFLPYWLTAGDRRTVDFSLFDRIAFHAIQLDWKGEISNPSLWSNKSDSEASIARLIKAANRHRVAVDVIVNMSDWMHWSQPQVARAANSIAAAVGQRFNVGGNDKSASATLVRLVHKTLPVPSDSWSADGVNLYFVGFEDPRDARKLATIVTAIHDNLDARNLRVGLSLTLGLDWRGIYGNRERDSIDIKLFEQLALRLSDLGSESGFDMVDNLFIFLPQNTDTNRMATSDSQLILRQAIDEAFRGRGETRTIVLRKTVPIITILPDAVMSADYFGRDNQFAEDLEYLGENFAGVGLWPMPTTHQLDESSIDAVAIGERLIEAYGGGSESGSLASDVENLSRAFCDFACPNRWLIRVTFNLMVAMIVIYWLLALWQSRLREYYKSRYTYFISYGGVIAAIFFISLVCDPFWSEKTKDLVIIILVMIGFVGGRYFGQLKRSKLP